MQSERPNNRVSSFGRTGGWPKTLATALAAFLAGGFVVGVFDRSSYRPQSRGFTLSLDTMDVIMINRALMGLPEDHARDTRHKIYAQIDAQVTTPQQEQQMLEWTGP